MMFAPENYTETDALIYDLQMEIEQLKAQPTIAQYIKDNQADWDKCHRKFVNISDLKKVAGVE